MHEALVHDRFFQDEQSRWRDLATGEVQCGDPRSDAFMRDRSDSPEVRRLVNRVVLAADVSGAIGIRTLRLVARSVEVNAVLSASARALQPFGFVTVRPAAGIPRDIQRALMHRHLVVFVGEREVAAAIRWIRNLSAVSGRSHLVVLIASKGGSKWSVSSPSERYALVRERARSYGSGHENRVALPADSEMESECSLEALANARQACDEPAFAGTALKLMEHLIIREDWAAARSAGHSALRRIHQWPLRIEISSALASTMIATGELSGAESLIQAFAAEAAVRCVRLPATLAICRAQIYFWQGRFEAASTALVGCPESADRSVWAALTAWACGCERSLEGAICGLSPASPLARAAVAEQWLARGDVDKAREVLRTGTSDRSSTPTVYSVLLQRLTAKSMSASRSPPDGVAQFIGVSGARGILRWGLGRKTVTLFHGVSNLLQLVHDADDEHLALRHGCSWVRDHVRASAVGIVQREGKVVAGEGLVAADLENDDLRASLGTGRGRTIADGPHAVVTAPMRYGGATIGFAVVKGTVDAVETLAEAAEALASVCAPALRARLDALALSCSGQALMSDILGRSPAMAALREAIARSAATMFPVLVEGESGTGKELVARALHRLSPRRDRRLSAINCAALTDELVEAELFGHTRGAFTGAVNARVGLFEEAHGSTLFLDEVSELSSRAQAKLLRVLQEREIRRLGEQGARPVDVRVVAATNQPLTTAVADGRFRGDLLFRLAVVRIRVPPLRDRVEDVPLLSQTFWRTLTNGTGKRALLGPDAIAALCRYAWPGNVRELQNVIAALVVAAPTRGRISARHVAQVLAAHNGDSDQAVTSLDSAREAFERRIVSAALARHGGRRTTAARELGISRQGLAKAMRRLGLLESHDEGKGQRSEGKVASS